MSTGDLTDYKNSGVINPFYKKLELVVESYLDGFDTAKWYAAADPKTGVDAIEVAFLHGREAPYIEQRQGWTVDGTEFKARIEFGVKAIDWRGLYCNDGN